jgi:hypothetical protein
MAEYSIRNVARDCGVSYREARDLVGRAREANQPIGNAADALRFLAQDRRVERHRVRRAEASALHRDDPRYRERMATARIDALKAAVARKERVTADELLERTAEEGALAKAALRALPNRIALDLVGKPHERQAAMIEAELEDALVHMRSDRLESWDGFELVDDGGSDVELEEPPEGSQNFIPRIPPHDPRHAVVALAAEERERELAAAQKESFLLRDVLQIVGEMYAQTKNHFRQLTDRALIEIDAETPAPIIISILNREVVALLVSHQDLG